MNYERIGNPQYKFIFNSQEATTLSDIMKIITTVPNIGFLAREIEFAHTVLNNFDQSEL